MRCNKYCNRGARDVTEKRYIWTKQNPQDVLRVLTKPNAFKFFTTTREKDDNLTVFICFVYDK